VNDKLRQSDMTHLMEQPEFRRFLFRAIQLAGHFDHTTRATNGSDGRDLAFAEGRRSLGFDLLRDAQSGQPEAVRNRDPLNLMTLVATITEEIQAPPEEKKRDGSDRYDSESEPE
jgi:hypothetical protein